MKKSIIILTVLSLCLLSLIYGASSRYTLSEDLPNLIANVQALEEFSIPAKSPFFIEGLPDFHATYTTATIAFLGKLNISNIPLESYNFLNSHSKQIFINYLFWGVLTVILFVTSAYSFSKRYFKDSNQAVLFTLITLFIVEIPLVRWSGVTSIHGIIFGSYYSQIFAISFLFLFLYSLLNSKVGSFAYYALPSIFSVIAFISHPLTGLVTFSLGVLYFSIEYFKKRNIHFLIMAFLLILLFLLSNLWIYVSIFNIINSIIPYQYVLSFFILIIPLSYLVLKIMDSFSLSNLDQNKILKVGILLTLAVSITALFNLGEYLYIDSVSYWLIAMFPFLFLGAFLSIKTASENKDSITYSLVCWFWALLVLFILGILGAPIKVFWRFLLMIRIPAAIFISAYLFSFIKNKKNIYYFGIFILILLISVSNMILVIQTSETSKYFKEIPPEFEVSNLIHQEGQIILSDPYTSYFISSLTRNYVIAIPQDRISDYEQEKNSESIKIIQKLYSPEADCKIVNNLNISVILLNKYISIVNGNRMTKAIDYNGLVNHFTKNCKFKTNNETQEYVMLIKDETTK